MKTRLENSYYKYNKFFKDEEVKNRRMMEYVENENVIVKMQISLDEHKIM